MAERRQFLAWVLVACRLTLEERQLIEGLFTGPPIPLKDLRPPTMVYRPTAIARRTLGIPDVDGHARVVLEDGETYISVAEVGWFPLALD